MTFTSELKYVVPGTVSEEEQRRVKTQRGCRDSCSNILKIILFHDGRIQKESGMLIRQRVVEQIACPG